MIVAFQQIGSWLASAARPIAVKPNVAGMLLVAVALAALSLPSAALADDPAHPSATTAADHGDAAGHGDAADHGEKLPGLVPKVDLAVWTLVTFVLFVMLLGRFAWKPLASGLQAREQKIFGDIQRAEENRLKSEQLLRDYEQRLAKVQEEVTEILAEARRDAAALRQSMLTSTQQEVEATKKRAVADIERARDQALTEVFDSVVTNVFKATEQLVGRSVRDDDNDRFVRTAIEQIGAGNN